MIWQIKKLGEVLKLEYGKPLPKTKRSPNGAYIVYGANGEKDRANEFYFDKPSIIVGRKGSAGEINLVNGKFWPLDVTYFVTFDDKKYDLKFLYNLLETLNLTKLAKGVKPGINRNDVYAIEVRIPPLLEQKRIVKILDEVFDGIEKAKKNAEKNLKNSQELFESYLQNLSGEKSALGALVDIKTGKLNANTMKENGQYPFFTCAREIYAIDSYSFDCEAILLAGNNAVGDFNVKHYNGRFDAYQRTYVITVNKENKILYRYLYYQLLKSLKEFKGKSVGTGTKFLKIGMIQDLQITLPSLAGQKVIVKKLDALSGETKKLEAIFRRKIADLAELKKSVLKQAFSGDL